jgi:hypothetical protein
VIVDSQVRPTQHSVGAPHDQSEAVSTASKTVSSSEAVLVEILRGNAALDALSAYATGDYLDTTNQFVDGLAESSTYGGVEGTASE